jgi:hypothetical protein
MLINSRMKWAGIKGGSLPGWLPPNFALGFNSLYRHSP